MNFDDVLAEVSQANLDLQAEGKAVYERFLGRVRAAEARLPPPETVSSDGFNPPKRPVRVECIHCGAIYKSDEMRWEYRLEFRIPEIGSHLRGVRLDDEPITPLWWCRDTDCDGGGFGVDIWPAPQRRKRK